MCFFFMIFFVQLFLLLVHLKNTNGCNRISSRTTCLALYLVAVKGGLGLSSVITRIRLVDYSSDQGELCVIIFYVLILAD